MESLLLWITNWAIVWLIYNWKVRKIVEAKGILGYFIGSSYFLFALISAHLYFQGLLPELSIFLFPLIITIISGLLLSDLPVFYKKLKRGRYCLIFHPVNILYQQVMIISAIYILLDLLGKNYKNYHFGLFFTLAHSPIIFLKPIYIKRYYLVATFIGGTLFSYFITHLPDSGYIFTFILHFLFYVALISYLKDDTKF